MKLHQLQALVASADSGSTARRRGIWGCRRRR